MNDTGVGSHAPVLAAVIASTKGDVLECGVGDYSTPLLHMMCEAMGRRLVSLETSQEWMDKWKYLDTSFTDPATGKLCGHEIKRVYDWDKVREIDEKWSVAFVDCSPGEVRPSIIRRLKGHVAYVVVHDWCADRPGSGGNYGWKTLDGLFTFATELSILRPTTAILSDIASVPWRAAQ